jgi:hypothetical protein
MNDNQQTPLLNRSLVRAILLIAALAAFVLAAGAPLCILC